MNGTVSGNNLIFRGNVNVGVAVDLDPGLIVPVIKNADQLNLIGLTKQVNDLAGRARQNKLKPEEIQGGTFTLTNVGTFGNVMGTALGLLPRRRLDHHPAQGLGARVAHHHPTLVPQRRSRRSRGRVLVM